MKQTLEKATAELRFPRLRGVQPFFGDDDEPVWKLRQLDHIEYFRLREVVTGNHQRLLKSIAEALSGSDAGKKADLMRELLGTSDAVPPELAYRIEAVLLGTVEPKVDRDAVLKLFEHWPADAWLIAEKVMELTGHGASVGKPKSSGETPKSKPRSHSATSGDDSSTKRGRTSSPKAT